MPYNIKSIGNIAFLTAPILEKYTEIFHGFTTRYGGVSKGCCESLNFGFGTDDSKENVIKNYEILADAIGISAGNLVISHQTHSKNVMSVKSEDMGKGVTKQRDYRNIDGLITNEKNIAIITAHADCIPLFFYDPVNVVVGVAHSGWKGTLNKIAEEMIIKFVDNYGSNPGDIIVSIGPSLCQSCFEVDEDVKDMFLEVNPLYKNHMLTKGIKTYIDLWKINEIILTDNGIEKENIENMNICTKCNMDKFFSHRGQKGKKGIMAAVMMIK